MEKSGVKINEAVTLKMAALSRLKLSTEEVKTFTPQLADLIKFIDQLSELDGKDVQPLMHPIEIQTNLREDVVVQSPRSASGSASVVECSVEVLEDSYRVPPILS
jgi:aspartyl/glutamyl-tRNA(Asn/Gln) amidotransferase C subunit